MSRAGHVVVDMKYLSAVDTDPIHRCASMVAGGDVYVLIAGYRFGGIATDRVDRSWTQLEYETATLLSMTRLVFVIEGEMPSTGEPPGHQRLQEAFRNRLRELTFVSVQSPAELELSLYQALVEWRLPTRLPFGRRRFVTGALG